MMMNRQTAKIAEILGVSEENISALPTDILGLMQAVIENINVRNEDDAKILCSELESYWNKGNVLLGLSDIARDTGISLDTLNNLGYDVQQELVYEHLADSSATDRLYEITNKALAVIELDSVAKLLEMPVGKLKEYPHDTQAELCSIYAMESDTVSEFELANRLRGVIGL